MLRRDHDEDLFKDSTMTFGEHLEELRAALFKAIIGLAVMFLVGLFIGNYVVRIISDPLEKALANYYEIQSRKMVETRMAEHPGAGKVAAGDSGGVKAFIERERLLADEAYLDPQEVLTQLRVAYPQLKDVLPPNTAEPTAPPPQATPDAAGSNPKSDATPNDRFAQLTRKNMIRLFLWHPREDDRRVRSTTLSAQEAFSIYMKASLLVGAIFASPWIFYQIWAFVAAGLYPHEKHYVHLFLPFSIGLFLLGVCLAFFFVFDPVLNFLLSFNEWLGIDPDPRISEWLGFVLILPLGFGIAFQLPLVMLFLERIGLFSVQAYLAKWRISILVIFVLAMILTPADPYSMLLMAIPLTFLFFGGVLLCHFMPRRRSPYEET